MRRIEERRQGRHRPRPHRDPSSRKGWRRLRPARHTIAGLLALAAATAQAAADEPCEHAGLGCPMVSTLLDQNEGYGSSAKGGTDGRIVVVRSAADDGPGTLRDALRQARTPTWIRFASDMTIELGSQVRVPSNVTIDGRGHTVKLLDYGLGIYGVSNVIVTHLTIDGRLRTFSQAINVANGTHDVWIDHLDLSRFADRLLDVKNGSTDVTVSWVKFHDDDKVMLMNNMRSKNLFAHYERDSVARVTMHHNYFVDTVQRNPRAQFGTIHLYNNLLEDWDFYGMSFSLEARVRLEGNIFVNASQRPCKEPPFYPTVEGIDSSYCQTIAGAPARSQLGNGEADRRAYEATQAEYGYTHDYRAFVAMRDNLYLGDARAGLEDYRPDQVPSVPYCYSYTAPTAQLADLIRAQAGNTDARVEAHCSRPLPGAAAPAGLQGQR